MTIKDLSFEKIENYDPYNSRAKKNGMVTEWVARNSWGSGSYCFRCMRYDGILCGIFIAGI